MDTRRSSVARTGQLVVVPVPLHRSELRRLLHHEPLGLRRDALHHAVRRPAWDGGRRQHGKGSAPVRCGSGPGGGLDRRGVWLRRRGIEPAHSDPGSVRCVHLRSQRRGGGAGVLVASWSDPDIRWHVLGMTGWHGAVVRSRRLDTNRTMRSTSGDRARSSVAAGGPQLLRLPHGSSTGPPWTRSGGRSRLGSRQRLRGACVRHRRAHPGGWDTLPAQHSPTAPRSASARSGLEPRGEPWS